MTSTTTRGIPPRGRIVATDAGAAAGVREDLAASRSSRPRYREFYISDAMTASTDAGGVLMGSLYDLVYRVMGHQHLISSF